jgi:tRNA-binding EMAP/Myf-like protein
VESQVVRVCGGLRARSRRGPEVGERTILSGVRSWYSTEDFEGKNFAFLVNLAEKKMGEGVSQGMMLMGDADQRAYLLEMPSELLPGTIIR